MLSLKELEKISKGIANHNRLKMLVSISKMPGITLGELAETSETSLKNASEHTRKMLIGGLIEKRYRQQMVEHRLTGRGKKVLHFCRLIK